MATKDITDRQVCEVYRDVRGSQARLNELRLRTDQPEKVAFRAIERACSRGLIDYGVSIGEGWLTDEGQALLQ